MTIKQALYLIVIAIVCIGGYVFIFRGESVTGPTSIYPQRGSVVEEVIVSGNVEAGTELDLAFERSGRIDRLRYSIGDKIGRNDVIATLANADLEAVLARRKAAESSERAKLNELVQGTRPEEIRVQEIRLENNMAAEAEELEGLVDEIKTALTKSDNAIYNLVDQLFLNPRTQNAELVFIFGNQSLKGQIEQGRVSVGRALDDWRTFDESFSRTTFTDDNSVYVLSQLEIIQDFLKIVGQAVNSLSASGDNSQTKIDGWRLDVSTARTNVDSARSGVISTRTKYNNARLSSALAQEELNLLLAGAREETIAAQQASLESATAEVSAAEAEIDKTILRAPFSGTIIEIHHEEGEIVSGNTPVVTFINNEDYEVILEIPEIDVSQIAKGNTAILTFDALGREEENFSGRVISINPSARIVEGVPTYETRIHLDKQDDRIRPGMTVDVRIETRRSENTLFLPLRAVINRDEGTFVQIIKGEQVVDQKVITGLRDANGNIEILNGISEEDLILD